VTVDGPVTANDADALVACASAGLGLAYVAEPELRDELASGRLVTVLDGSCPEMAGLFLYYPRAAQRVPKLAAFVASARAARSG
jgi:DNA-binding transcriptional LysR family regulator